MAYSESILLPSRGIIYNLPNFDGNVSVKPFTTKSYKSLLAGNASETALKQFIDECLVECPIKARNMNQHDLLALLFKVRVMTLGNTIKTQVKCPKCGLIEDIEWDLNNIKINYLCANEYPIPVKLPCGKEIRVRFPTGYDINKAKQEADKRAKTFKLPSDEFFNTFATVAVIDVDGKDIIEKAEWYESLNPRDAIFIDEVLNEMNGVFGVEMTRDDSCSKCEYEFATYIDIGSDFFRPYSNISTGITSQTGNLAGVAEKPNISQ